MCACVLCMYVFVLLMGCAGARVGSGAVQDETWTRRARDWACERKGEAGRASRGVVSNYMKSIMTGFRWFFIAPMFRFRFLFRLVLFFLSFFFFASPSRFLPSFFSLPLYLSVSTSHDCLFVRSRVERNGRVGACGRSGKSRRSIGCC